MTKDKLGDKFSKFLEGQGIEVIDVTPKKQKPIMANSPQLKPNDSRRGFIAKKAPDGELMELEDSHGLISPRLLGC